MFKNNNTLKEISYIFIWLFGIILFYTLIYKWFATPTTAVDVTVQENNEMKETKKSKESNSHQVSNDKVIKIQEEKSKTIATQKSQNTKEIHVLIGTKELATTEEVHKNKELIHKTAAIQIKESKVLPVATTKNKTQKQVKTLIVPASDTQEDQAAYIKFLESARELVIQEAEKNRQEALMILRPEVKK